VLLFFKFVRLIVEFARSGMTFASARDFYQRKIGMAVFRGQGKDLWSIAHRWGSVERLWTSETWKNREGRRKFKISKSFQELLAHKKLCQSMLQFIL
jgi:hypothetical protein